MSKLFSPTSLAIGFMAGAIIGYGWSTWGTVISSQQASNRNLPTSLNTLGTGGGSVSVVNQIAGESVTIESVTVPPPGVWVAVRELIGSELGNILGAARVSAPRTSVTVHLLRSTEPGNRYAVQLYRDNGDGEFNLSTDSVYVDYESGERVVQYFNTIE